MEPVELAAALQRLAEWAERHAPEPEGPLRRRLADHLGTPPETLPVVRSELGSWERPNLQLALDAWLGPEDRSLEAIGMSSDHGYRMGIAEIAQGAHGGFVQRDAPVEYTTVEVGERSIVCISGALLLLRDGETPLVAILGGHEDGYGDSLEIEVMAAERADGEAFLADLRELMNVHNVFRGQVVEVSVGAHGGVSVDVQRVPRVSRDDIVLPEGVLGRIERHTVGFARHAERLRAARRHLKRGLLLHGPPGTGKTLTAMYLASAMPERTTLLLSGQSLHVLEPAIRMARDLQPAMVVLEDVDLVALDRARYRANPVLFSLLNAMDGLAEDADVVFVLTTNRPEGLEAALAQRPGRIDQAVELTLPDADGRRRLFELYGEGLALDVGDVSAAVERADGTSPAFIREALRRATLLAADEAGDGELVVGTRHLDLALDELEQERESLTGALLGARTPEAEVDVAAAPYFDRAGASGIVEQVIDLTDDEDD